MKPIAVNDHLSLQPVRVDGRIEVEWACSYFGESARNRWRNFWRSRRKGIRSTVAAAKVCREFAERERQREQQLGAKRAVDQG